MPPRLTTGSESDVIGAVATFRDKSEVQVLAEELTGVRRFVAALRAQAHEFANKLQALSDLLSLREYDAAMAFIQKDVRTRQDLVGRIARAVRDPAVAGLLIGKASEADEAGVQVKLVRGSHLEPLGVGPVDAGALVTILGEPDRERSGGTAGTGPAHRPGPGTDRRRPEPVADHGIGQRAGDAAQPGGALL
jgi:sensor histidine kinase regulating citrate/malate metabolism